MSSPVPGAVGSLDIEVELIAWLTDANPGATVCAELTNALATQVPLVQVQHAAGDDDGIRLDRAIVQIDTFAATRAGASQLAAAVRGQLLTRLRGAVTDSAVFGRVSTIAAPVWMPYENTALRRFVATYQVFFHPR